RRLDQARYAGFTVQAFKPALDDRYAIEAVASHREIRFPAIAVPDAAALRAQVHDDTRVIGIDEAQFFEPDVVTLAEELANRCRHHHRIGVRAANTGAEPVSVVEDSAEL